MGDWDFSNASIELKALYYIPFVVAPLSCISSCFVIYLIARPSNRKNLWNRPRDQLLLGMSVLDVLSSFGLSFSTTPGPSILMEESEVIHLPTYGTVQTCTAQGFFVHMGIGVPFYSAAICIYYVLSIRYKYTDRDVMKRLIPVVHCLVFLFVASTAVAALLLDLFNFAGYLGCWIGKGKTECLLDPQYCGRGRHEAIFSQFVILIPVATCLLIVILSMITIYCTVRTIEARSRRWAFERSATLQRGVSANSLSPESPESGSELRTATTSQNGLTRRTMMACLLYSGAFLVVYIPISVTGFINKGSVNIYVYKTLRVVATFFFPLQGFLNMLIFTSHVWRKQLKEWWGCQLVWCSQVHIRSSRHATMSDSGGRDQHHKREFEAHSDVQKKDSSTREDIDGLEGEIGTE